jgi:hypothetical protein
MMRQVLTHAATKYNTMNDLENCIVNTFIRCMRYLITIILKKLFLK